MNQGTVQAVGKSRSGKPTVTIDGQIYSASKVDLGTMRVGDRIEFDSASSLYNGATVWFLNGWKLLEGERKYPPSQQPMYNPSVASTPNGSGIQDAERPCVSNWGAELIKAGIIKQPSDLQAWITAIKKALRE